MPRQKKQKVAIPEAFIEEMEPEEKSKPLTRRLREQAGRLTEWRDFLGITPEFVQRQTRIAVDRLAEIEAAQRGPEPDELVRLLMLYHAPFSWIQDGSTEIAPSTKEALSTVKLNDFDKRAVNMFVQFLQQYWSDRLSTTTLPDSKLHSSQWKLPEGASQPVGNVQVRHTLDLERVGGDAQPAEESLSPELDDMDWTEIQERIKESQARLEEGEDDSSVEPAAEADLARIRDEGADGGGATGDDGFLRAETDAAWERDDPR